MTHRHYRVVCSRCERTVRSCDCRDACYRRTDYVAGCAICAPLGITTA